MDEATQGWAILRKLGWIVWPVLVAWAALKSPWGTAARVADHERRLARLELGALGRKLNVAEERVERLTTIYQALARDGTDARIRVIEAELVELRREIMSTRNNVAEMDRYIHRRRAIH